MVKLPSCDSLGGRKMLILKPVKLRVYIRLVYFLLFEHDVYSWLNWSVGRAYDRQATAPIYHWLKELRGARFKPMN